MGRKKAETNESIEKVETEQKQGVEEQNETDEVEQQEETQKKYVVIHDFKDLMDNNTIYIKGDIYPRRADAVIDEERVEELMSSNNKIGKPLIQEQA